MTQDVQAATIEAVREAGGGASLGRALGLTRQAIYQWAKVPPEHVLKVEQISGVSRQRLRPDLYPPEAGAA